MRQKNTKKQKYKETHKYKETQKYKEINKYKDTYRHTRRAVKISKNYIQKTTWLRRGGRGLMRHQYKVKYRETHKYKYRQATKLAEISMYHDKATPWLRRGVSDQGRKATSVETSRITPICIHLFTHLSILHSFIQLTNLSGCIFVLIFWLVCLVRLEFIFLQKLQFSY